MFNNERPLLSARTLACAVFLAAIAPLTACSDDDDPMDEEHGDHDDDHGNSGASDKSLYAVMTQLSSADESLSYFKTIDALKPQTVDLDSAREFTGLADAWYWEGAVYIASAEDMTITKYKLSGNQLTKDMVLSFAEYGLTDLAFWVTTFISPTKAWTINGTTEYIAWNPKTMEITGTVPMPELEERSGHRPFASYTDRSVALRDGLLYHPFYYTNDDYFEYDPSTSIAVYDVKTDKLVRVIEAPCPGLDHATQDDDGNLYFSSWVFAPGGAALLEQPATCVAKIAKGADKATVDFEVKKVTGGFEGGVLRYTGDGKGSLAVFHPEHASAEEEGDIQATTWGTNWKFYSYDFETKKAVEVDDDADPIGWNSGTAYGTTVDDKSYILVQTDEGGTTIFDITKPDDVKSVFTVDGWTMRLLKLR